MDIKNSITSRKSAQATKTPSRLTGRIGQEMLILSCLVAFWMLGESTGYWGILALVEIFF
jgi:hypothetical protein